MLSISTIAGLAKFMDDSRLHKLKGGFFKDREVEAGLSHFHYKRNDMIQLISICNITQGNSKILISFFSCRQINYISPMKDTKLASFCGSS